MDTLDKMPPPIFQVKPTHLMERGAAAPSGGREKLMGLRVDMPVQRG
jgi:hypothetical protein